MYLHALEEYAVCIWIIMECGNNLLYTVGRKPVIAVEETNVVARA